MLSPNTVLQGRYRIVRQLGQGGMGAVFEAIDERLDTTVALKETLFADERLRKQFEREARLLARLHHPALPRVSDHFSEADGQFLVMQYIGGEDLSEMFTRRRGPFPADQVLSWADQLLDALDYLHTQEPQIIHRDIKPQNLKLTARGQIILLDFGLAKGQASEVSRVTTAASIFGYTPNYAPLEQVQGLGTDPRSDIYALSATLYHLLTGTKPPDALTRAAAIVNAQPDPLLPANEVNSAISAETAKVLECAMSQNREQRYPTAAAMRRALQAGGETATVTNRTEADTMLFPPSAPAVATATQHILTPATLHAPRDPVTALPGDTTVVRSASQRRGFSPVLWAGLVVVFLAVGGLGYYAYKQRSNSAAASAPPSPVPTPVQSATPNEPITSVTTEAPADSSSEKVSQPVVAKKEKAASDKAKTPAHPESKSPNVVVERDTPADAPDEPDVADPEPPNVPSPRNRSGIRRIPNGSTIRTLPDGTEIITAPNGTRLIVKPDGTRQIFGPRPRVAPRRVAPRY